jgi:hypothetical protein
MSTHDEALFLALGRLEGKVDTLLTLQKVQEEQIKDHDQRLRSLEHSKAFLMGSSAIIGAVVSAAFSLFTKFFTTHN